ncbi:BA75_01504T0 [Komagataella pastoris]|uniref:Protein transport protein SEC23 n=1 Tax=Komagataella pastoris TaxID=4922 RepID=A0A1B2J934_PICPA|nr:BA75_01504T0 [Komagataella pastoris]
MICRACKAIFNPFVTVQAQHWTCSFCATPNVLLPHYHNQIPYQASGDCTTIEYVLSKRVSSPPAYVYLVDTSLEAQELESLKESILTSFELLPKYALVSLITFGRNVNVHELENGMAHKYYTFNGSKTYDLTSIQRSLGLLSRDLRRKDANESVGGRFLKPLGVCEFSLSEVVQNLSPDVWPKGKFQRSLRATGAALDVALHFMDTCLGKTGAHLMLFAGGPCTLGPGIVVGSELKEPIRSHYEIQNGSAKHYKKSLKHYAALSKRATSQCHSVDVFAASYDQIGLSEMELLVDQTGGALVLTDAFSTAIFKQSFQRFLQLPMGINGTLEVKTSSDLKINGLVGHATSLERKAKNVSDTEIGRGKTDAWKLCNLLPQSSFGIYFEMPATNSSQTTTEPRSLIQFITYYQEIGGTLRLKVTTLAKPILQQSQESLIAEYFDQEAAVVLISRQMIDKMVKDNSTEVIRELDKILVELCKKFGSYQKNDAQSFRLGAKFSLFPQFLYHLRRSQFMQVFNNSPDETTFYRHSILTEDTFNSLIMIQPTLTAYEINQEPQPIFLDSMSITADRILLLDTFFQIVIYHGETIVQWREAKYQEQEEFAYLKDFFQLPREDAADLLIDRFPLPRFIDCDAGGSQARFLLSKVNPTTSYKDNQMAAASQDGGAIVGSDDVSLQSFMEHVQMVVVKSV